MSSVTSWQTRSPYLGAYQLPAPGALTVDTRTPAPAVPTRRVRALAASWRINGREVVEGELYEVAADTAEGLVARGKAAFT